jgi:hypothetical protein
MTFIYEEVKSELGEDFIRATDGNVILLIPKDPANSDYQRYLNPEAEQSTPNLAVDEAKIK